MAKKVPNPNGRKGGQGHQDKTNEVAEDIEKRGFIPSFEHYVEVINGIKNRFVDVAALEHFTLMPIEFHQIGRQNKDGTPVMRERRAITDIEKALGIVVVFHPYNTLLWLVVGGLVYQNRYSILNSILS
jgi:hypothetical protein